MGQSSAAKSQHQLTKLESSLQAQPDVSGRSPTSPGCNKHHPDLLSSQHPPCYKLVSFLPQAQAGETCTPPRCRALPAAQLRIHTPLLNTTYLWMLPMAELVPAVSPCAPLPALSLCGSLAPEQRGSCSPPERTAPLDWKGNASPWWAGDKVCCWC